MKMFRDFVKKRKVLLLVILLVIIATVLVIIFFQGKHPFSRRNLREIESDITEFGEWSPFVVIILVVISTVVPPLPLPVPLIEIASGLAFGFWYGALISFVAHIISSLFAFYFSRILGKRIIKRFFSKYHFLNYYKEYLNRGGARSVLIMRALMVAPFNLVSYLAGLTQMSATKFSIATAIGVIPESILFSFIGSRIKTVHMSLWYVFVFVVILGGFGLVTTFIFLEVANLREKKKR